MNTVANKLDERGIQYQIQLLEYVSDAVIVTDLDFKILSWNKAAESLYGWSKEEVIGKPMGEVIPTEYLEENREAVIAAFQAEGSWQGEVIQQGNDGGGIYVRASVNLIKDSAGDPSAVLAIYRDISISKQTELALRASEAKLRAVIEQSPVSIQIHGLDGRLLLSNPAYAKLYALNDEALKELHEKYNVRTDAQAEALGVAPYIEKVYSGEDVVFPPYEYDGVDTLNTLDFENPVSRKCWVRTLGFPLKDESGNVTSVVFMSEDITDRKQAEQAHRESEKRLLDAQRIARLGNWSWDIPSDTITWSDEVYRIYGIDVGTPITYDRLMEAIHPEDREYHNEKTAEWLEQRGGDPFEYRVVHPDGFIRHIFGLGEVACDQAGNPIRMYGSLQDVTERTQYEEQILAHQERLKALAAQLTIAEERERRRIAADLHDHVSQSLSLARIQLGRARKVDSESRREAMLIEVSQTLIKVIQDTRALTFELSSPLLKELGLEKAIAAWLRDQIGSTYDLETKFLNDGWQKPLTEDEQVILFRNVRELLGNAVRHAQATEIQVSIERELANIIITIQDDGIGFDPGSTLQYEYPEDGFGLFSIQERMADFGGSLEIISAPGMGCTVVLTAPLDLG